MQRWRVGVPALAAALPAMALLLAVHARAADPAPALPDGKKTITLVSNAGERLLIGDVTFAKDPKDETARTFEINVGTADFREEFLSMRPFQCARGEKETWCYLPYPYDNALRISGGDLTSLEYALLFLFKPPADYGISTWNGLYFKLAANADGSISGPVQDVNLEPLGVPPDNPAERVIKASDLSPADPATHRFSRIEIK